MTDLRTPAIIAVSAPTCENTAAVVVLFRPEGDLIARLRRVQSQVARLFVISNDDATTERLYGLDLGRLEHVQNNGNLGLAAALNIGLKRAREDGFAWCLLLDQDSLVDENLLVGLAATFAAYPQRDQVGVLAPNYRSPGGARFAYPTDVPCQQVSTAVTSGSVVRLSVAEQVGWMREAFFIEGIDLEFCLRMRAAGMHLVAGGQPLMTHGAGDAEERHFFGRIVLVGNHPPARCFLQFRNLTWTLIKYGRADPKWAAVTLGALCKRIVLVCLFERQRGAKLWAMMRGVAVGIRQVFVADDMHAHRGL